MTKIKREITKEEYEQALEKGAGSLISDYVKMGYGVYSSSVRQEGDTYILEYSRGDSCD